MKLFARKISAPIALNIFNKKQEKKSGNARKTLAMVFSFAKEDNDLRLLKLAE